MVAAALFSVLSVVSGITLAFVMNLPAGGVIVVINILLFMLAFAWRKLAWARER
jgi:ABC-type Mn2+/Zn2+ transport system permease subunit